MKEDNIPNVDISNFPSIEIDTEYWKTLSPKEKLQYLSRVLFHEKNLGDKMNMMNFIIRTSSRIVRALVKNKEVRDYMTVLEYTGDMVNTTVAVGNLFKAKQHFRNTKNNEIAKLMGFPNGSHVEEASLDVTNSMVEAFLDLNETHKERYSITIDNVISDDKNKGAKNDDEESVSINKKITIIGTYGPEERKFKFGMIFNLIGSVFEGETTISTTKGKLFYPVNGMKMDPSDFVDELQKIFYEMYVEKVDAAKNIIRINGTRFEVIPRQSITEDIVNVNISRIADACRKTLEEKRRRGVVFVGEPGTGKTIAVHKIINMFRDKLVFWVSVDSVNTPTGIRNIKKLFKMFEGCIVVFDDLDAAPLTLKNETTNEFLSMLDGTNKMSCFLMATVNDPSKIHMTLINRAERFDDIVHVKKPQSVKEISDIFFSKVKEFGYYHSEDRVSPFTVVKGSITFKHSTPKFISCCKKILENGFTQVMVAGLVRDCDTYSKTGNITISDVDEAINARLESIQCANMKSIKGRLEVDMNDVSDEAKAMMHR